MKRILTWTLGVSPLLFSLLSVGTAAAQQTEAGTVSIPKQVYVVGRDKGIDVTAQLPAACAGSVVSVTLYTRGPAAAVNPKDEVFTPASGSVSSDGSVRVLFPLPAQLPSGPRTGSLGLEAPCLSRPLFSGVGPVLVAIDDPAENKDSSGTFVVPGAFLTSTTNIGGGGTLAQSLGTLTALADGQKCITVDLAQGSAVDGQGNARIHVGGKGQPLACSREGAIITFVDARGQTLFEKRTLIVGVTQPYANLAPEAVPTGSGSAPGAPQAGSGAGSTGSILPVAILAIVLASAASVAIARRRLFGGRPSG